MKFLTRCLAVFTALFVLTQTAAFGEGEWTHATSLTGTPKYPAGFPHFEYVNPQAPKGGLVRLSSTGSFDTFNPILPRGEIATGIGLIYESLMTSSFDELDISAEYGLLAEATKHADDNSWVSFRLNPNAKWHDGMPVTVEDVIWSFKKVTELNPQQKFYYANVISASKTGEREVTFAFDVKNNRELPHIMGQLTILPKHWWEGKDANGKLRDITRSTLEPPLGSGPYRIGKFQAGRSVTFERVEDHWSKDLNINVGKNNFDKIRYEYYRDSTVLLQGFKADQYDYRRENSAKNWATGYENFPAREKGYVELLEFPDKASGVMQAFVPNLRRDKFKDANVRRALGLAYDFETLNRTVFFGQYLRVPSYFAGTELASSGLPQGKELEILEKFRGRIPDDVFTTPYENPTGGDNKKLRANLKEAVALMKKAGWVLKGRKMVHAETGEPFVFEYLDHSQNGERSVLPWKKNLERIGITLNYRVVDTSQYVNRLRAFDFDMVTFVWGQSLSPGNEQRNYWGSDSANRTGSRNFAGISDPAIDALIDEVIFAGDRETLVAATRALDRALLWSDFVIPQFYYPFDRIAMWDRFGRPEKLPEYTVGFPMVWWFDEEKAKKIP